jgi:thiol-disulfide isomerase/thioredoxin
MGRVAPGLPPTRQLLSYHARFAGGLREHWLLWRRLSDVTKPEIASEVCPVSAARCVLVILLAAPLLRAQVSSPDGMTLLRQMSRHYASAAAWHIEAAEDRTVWNESCNQSSSTSLIGAESGNAYHYESQIEAGSALHVSDGAVAWDFHSFDPEYRKHTAPTGGYTPDQSSYRAEATIPQAMSLRSDLAAMADLYNSATRMSDGTISDTGVDIPCYVVRVTDADRKVPKAPDDSMSEDSMPQGSMTDTLWIDKQTMAVLKREQRVESFAAGNRFAPVTIESSTRYGTVQLSGPSATLRDPAPTTLFHFHPPAGAALVEQFSDRHGRDMNGVATPEIQLVGADGARVPLSSYRGKPVLLDIWATWCQPCIAGMPKLAELAAEALPKGLVLPSVDEDREESRATKFLAAHNYTWPNTHDDGSIEHAFNDPGLPRFVLIDAQGKIVFYGSDEDDYGLRMAVAALGPQYESLAPAPKPEKACAMVSK